MANGDAPPVLPSQIGTPASGIGMPKLGQTKLALTWHSPDSNKTRNVSGLEEVGLDVSKGAGFHRSPTIDFGVVLFGELELEVEGAGTVLLSQGSSWVLTGQNHIWHNPGSEDCVCMTFMMGAEERPFEEAYVAPNTQDASPPLVRHALSAYDAENRAIFISSECPVERSYNDTASGTWIWEAPQSPTIPDQVGGVPTLMGMPTSDSVKFGIQTFKSAGTAVGKDLAKRSHHATDSIEFAVILSGELEIDFPDCDSLRLSKGSFLIHAGVPHVWRSVGQEPCKCAMISLGANRLS
jgi:quercetin dioxygenase-like cupin family protein